MLTKAQEHHYGVGMITRGQMKYTEGLNLSDRQCDELEALLECKRNQRGKEMIQIIPEQVRDLQISLTEEKYAHKQARLMLDDCSEQLKELIKASNEKVGELNRELETELNYEKKLSDPEKLEFRNTIDGLKQELLISQRENKRLKEKSDNLLLLVGQCKRTIEKIIEETVT